MSERDDYKQLRVTTGLGDDNDYAASQTMPSASDLVELRAPGAYRGKTPLAIKVEIVLEWLDAASAPVTTAGRGSYDVQAVRVLARRTPLTGSVAVDSARLTGQLAYRPVVISEMLDGDSLSVRLSNMQAPTGATKARVLYREIV